MVVDERMFQWSLCPSFLEALLTSFISSLFMALACALTSPLGQDSSQTTGTQGLTAAFPGHTHS